MNDNKYYVTSPIYYVNDVPHIGHAYTTIICDILARSARAMGKQTYFLTGTDEHGQKIEKSAAAKDIDPQIFTDIGAKKFIDLMAKLNISNDYFIRTSQEKHKQIVANIWQKLIDSGDIYLGKYSGWYSIRDEAYFAEDELTTDGKAPTGADVVWLDEPSYFFKLSAYQDRLLALYDTRADFVKPTSRLNEVKSFVKSGLTDLSISRTSFHWGIKVPNDEAHVIYVWLDALANYISALGYTSDDTRFKKFWPADVHVVGKDILRFHAVYWPAFLMALDLPLPKTILAHGWWTIDGEKMSKSLGNVVDPIALIDEFGIDQVRYFLSREVILGNDGNYSKNNLINRLNSELANKIGNLLQRTLSFIAKNNYGKVPDVNIELAYSSELIKIAQNYAIANISLISDFKLNDVLDNIIELASKANIYIDAQAPWKLKSIDPKKMCDVLYVLLEAIRYIAIMLKPFMPSSAEAMLDQLAVPKSQRDFEHLTAQFALLSNTILPTPIPIFPRIEI